jgi:phage terminase large subunit
MEGAIYYSEMMRARADSRVCRVPWEPSKPVHTFWDLGNRDPCAVWFFQHIGMEYRFIDYWEGSDVGGLPAWARMLREKPYIYGTHHWPHDGAFKQLGTGRILKDMAEEIGIRPIKIVPRTKNKQASIERLRPILSRAWFDSDRCAGAVKRLEDYRREWDDRLGQWSVEPRHDMSSHTADALMTMADGYDGRATEFYDFGDRAGYADADYDVFNV